MTKSPCLSEATMNRLYDGDLPDQERTAVEQHLQQCGECRARWEAFVEGEEQLQGMFQRSAIDRSECPDDDVLAAYTDDALPEEEAARVAAHLRECSACNQIVLSVRFLNARWAKEQARPHAVSVADGVLGILTKVPDAAERVADWVREGGQRVVDFIDDITLPCFEPRQLAVQRLAAGTGEGFKRQSLDEPESPFHVELVQFGKEARIVVTAKAEATGFHRCLVQVYLREGEDEKVTRSCLVSEGKGQCVLTPEEVERIRPEETALKLSVRPIVTLAELEALEAEAAVTILSDLLNHKDPVVRRLSVELLGRAGGEHALQALVRAKSDPDPDVRRAAEDAQRRREREDGGEGDT